MSTSTLNKESLHKAFEAYADVILERTSAAKINGMTEVAIEAAIKAYMQSINTSVSDEELARVIVRYFAGHSYNQDEYKQCLGCVEAIRPYLAQTKASVMGEGTSMAKDCPTALPATSPTQTLIGKLHGYYFDASDKDGNEFEVIEREQVERILREHQQCEILDNKEVEDALRGVWGVGEKVRPRVMDAIRPYLKREMITPEKLAKAMLENGWAEHMTEEEALEESQDILSKIEGGQS